MNVTETVVPPAMHRRQRIKGVAWFLGLAFGLAWLPFLAVLVNHAASGSAPILMPFAPAIACLVVRKWITREGFGDAGLRFNVRSWPLYLLAVVWPLATSSLCAALAVALHAAPAGFALPWGLAAPSTLTLLTWGLGSILLAPILFGEEFGWRGYLQVRLMPNRPHRASVVIGLIWGVWHYPLILLGGERLSDPLLTLLIFPISTTVFAVFLGWLRLRTGSVWPGSVAHAANNGAEDSLHRLAFTGHVDGTPTFSSTAPSLLAEAVVLVGIVAADQLRRRSRGTQTSADGSAGSGHQAA